MRIQQPYPAALGRQLAEWRLPLDNDPDVDEAVTRMLSAIDNHLRHQPEARERNGCEPG